MTDLLVRGAEGVSPALRVRAAASVAMTECLRIQASARPQSRPAVLFGLGPLTTDARAWYRGALGELQVARVLRALPAGWRMLCSADPDVAQLLIGPAGVFTIHTRDHVGQRVIVGDGSLLVNGRRTNHLADARHEAVRASRLLSTGVGETVDVTPVIAIVDPGSLQLRRFRPLDVIVLASPQLARVLLRRPRRLTDHAAAALVARATTGGTWHTAEHLVDETRRLETRFERLQHAVRAAARRRAAWLLGVGGLLAATLFAVLI